MTDSAIISGLIKTNYSDSITLQRWFGITLKFTTGYKYSINIVLLVHAFYLFSPLFTALEISYSLSKIKHVYSTMLHKFKCSYLTS